MCLAESLLRIPDLQISKEFVRDKLSNKSWESFLFKKAKSFKTIFLPSAYIFWENLLTLLNQIMFLLS